MTPNWTWTLNSQKYPVHTKDYPWGPNFAVSLYDQRFPIARYRTFYNTPLTPMLNGHKKNNLPKIEISQFFIQLWQRPFLGICLNFWEQICRVLSDKMFEVFSPKWPHVNENDKKKRNWQNYTLYNCGRDSPYKYAWMNGVNLLCTFRGDVWIFSPMLRKKKIVKI